MFLLWGKEPKQMQSTKENKIALRKKTNQKPNTPHQKDYNEEASPSSKTANPSLETLMEVAVMIYSEEKGNFLLKMSVEYPEPAELNIHIRTVRKCSDAAGREIQQASTACLSCNSHGTEAAAGFDVGSED